MHAQFDQEFFPTPPAVIRLMLAKISKDATRFLEPSAGKGDIADAIRAHKSSHFAYSRREPEIECLEKNPDLCAVLTGKGYSVVGCDWLAYDGVATCDVILQNPPFSQGAEHLLKSWDFLYDGEIVCLLNEETIKNPHTAKRKLLASIIERHGTVEYLGDCFSTGERKTGVNVVMVYLKKTAVDDSAELWARATTEREALGDIGQDPTLPTLQDKLGNMQHYYDSANEHMIKAFAHIRKAAAYMEANSVSSDAEDYRKIMGAALRSLPNARVEYLKEHRKDVWRSVFAKMDFHKWLDKKQREDFIRDIERNGNIPFTKENIKGTLENVFMARRELFEKSVANVFDELVKYYKGNANHTEGWKSNSPYKVNKKLVFPWGCKFDTQFKYFSTNYGRGDMDLYNDLDRVLCVMDGRDFTNKDGDERQCRTIGAALENKFRILGHNVGAGFDGTTESTYFNIKFFKKGTVHLEFKDAHLWQEFNKTAARGRMWVGQEAA